MNRGKKTCRILKDIRKQIARQNDIELIITECHFQGECKGTCPKCEAEIRHLESELALRRQVGKAVTIAGISLGLATSFSACNSRQEPAADLTSPEIHTETLADTISQNTGNQFFTKTENDTIPPPPAPGKIPEWGDTITTIIDGLFIMGEISSMPIDSIDSDVYSDVLTYVDQMPEYPGGMDSLYSFLKKNIQIPEVLKGLGINHAYALIRFIVEKDGKISNFHIEYQTDPIFPEEVIRVLGNMPNWTPARHNGEIVRCYFSLPVGGDIE